MRTNSSPSDERTRARYRRTFDYVTVLAPHLLTLVGDKAKGVELDSLIREASSLPFCIFRVLHVHRCRQKSFTFVLRTEVAYAKSLVVTLHPILTNKSYNLLFPPKLKQDVLIWGSTIPNLDGCCVLSNISRITLRIHACMSSVPFLPRLTMAL